MGHRIPFSIGVFLCFFGILSAETTDNNSATVEKTNTHSTTNSSEKKAAEKVDQSKENAGPETAEISENKQPSDNATNPSKEKQPAESTKSLEGKNASTTTDSSKQNTSSETSAEAEGDALILEDGDELILDGGEEYILHPKSTKKTSSEEAAETAGSGTTDSITSDTAPKMSESVKDQDHTSEKDTSLAEAKNNEAPPPKTPTRVEKAGSINFARNLKEYRSPKLAMLLSLFFPGAGQAYAKGYVKTAAFVAAESAILGVSAYFSVKARNKRQKAQDFADKHYDVNSFKQYYSELHQAFDSIYGDPKKGDTIINNNFTSVDDFFKSAEKKSGDYYSSIESPTYVQGWDDCEPSINQMRQVDNTSIINGENGTYKLITPNDSMSIRYRVKRIKDNGEEFERSELGFSQNFDQYRNMIDDVNKESRTARNVFSLILINHIASAIDAGITAKAYNDKLLGKESFWQRINIEQQYVESATGEIPGLALKVKF